MINNLHVLVNCKFFSTGFRGVSLCGTMRKAEGVVPRQGGPRGIATPSQDHRQVQTHLLSVTDIRVKQQTYRHFTI